MGRIKPLSLTHTFNYKASTLLVLGDMTICHWNQTALDATSPIAHITSAPAHLCTLVIDRITKRERNFQGKEILCHLAGTLTLCCSSDSIALASRNLAQGGSPPLGWRGQFLQCLLELHLFAAVALGFYCSVSDCTLTGKPNNLFSNFVQNFLGPQQNSSPSNHWAFAVISVVFVSVPQQQPSPPRFHESKMRSKRDFIRKGSGTIGHHS